MEVVNLKNVTYQYPTSKADVLKNVSLQMESGRVYALIGENGGGKSTICSLIRGFIPHLFKGELTGETTVFGKNVAEVSLGENAKKIGYVAQNPFTQISGATESVFEEVAYGLENLGVDRDSIMERVNNVLEIFHIDDLASLNPTELSGGQKQRVALASVFAMDPDLFIVDEPTSQLDPVGTKDVFEIVSKLKDLGKTVLLVENKVELVARYADTIFLVQNGQVVDQGSPRELFVKPSTAEAGAFIPQYTLLAQALKNSGYPVKQFPVLKEEAVALLQTVNQKEAGG
ncbi:energy-coupling factor ABC transporter ATP-binding protein [Lacticaseibacillus paracasei]|uniref:energy-coupling factor ABC transporter ATP-binding protein n=1 Tax=Lacticaseibacillus paracasei TaxID=1597 RepID=UPI0007BF6790|nr:ABC transporter ATP-binding protein [Lacticaseibacillus paracasei]URW91246.1 energy-coupling factor ABC transporter ATP-binding protein [Lacticaseibacillus paracasei]